MDSVPTSPVTSDDRYCPRFQQAIELVGRRWTGAVVLVLLGGPARYCEIRAAIPNLSDRLLAERLRELEAEGVVIRDQDSESDAAYRYRLTPKGRELAPVVDALATWSTRWIT
ncbi:MAG: winged helix-turn-helix transcriptional regulator [Ilumatobacteraceae bacterium]